MKNLILIGVLATAAFAQGQSVEKFQYMRRGFELIAPHQNENGFPTEPARVCSVRTPTHPQTCFTLPESDAPYATSPRAQVVALNEKHSAILFEASAYAVGSGGTKLLALLEMDDQGGFRNLFQKEFVITMFQSEYELRMNTKMLGLPLFVTAQYVWAEDEGHFGPHRYTVSLYAYNERKSVYSLLDRFETVRKYDGEEARVLSSEKSTIIARIQRLSH